jgi:hypothetical protein
LGKKLFAFNKMEMKSSELLKNIVWIVDFWIFAYPEKKPNFAP